MSQEFKPIKSESGNIVGARYDDGTLFVKFKNDKVFQYPDFPADKYQEFELRFDGTWSESAGKFFYREIRNLPCEEVKA